MNMKYSLISIIVPTYKEAGNIPLLVERIDQTMISARLPYEIIVVDDNSQDGIVDCIVKLKNTFTIKIVVRKNEKGLSSAVLTGFHQAAGEILVVMDADLSHPPEKIPSLVRKIIETKSQFALGSRFVKGGSAPYFNFYRRMNAFISKLLARPLTPVKDPMAGFFAIPKCILKNRETLNPLGFKIGLEIMVKCAPKNIVEIPIDFQERIYGESKLSLTEQIKYLVHLKRLYQYKFLSHS
jgi:dolichol-phosphate mannosyltransferase